MEEKNIEVVILDWRKNPVIIAGIITGVLLLVTIMFYQFIDNRNYMTIVLVLTIISGILTMVFKQSQCNRCKRVFVLNHISNEILKKWEEQKQYKPKTIYYYSDGETIKDEKYGNPKTFIAKYEKHKDGYECKKCSNIQYETKDIFLNKKDWERVNTPNEVTTKTKVPKEHHNNSDTDFSLDLFDDSFYYEGSGQNKKRKSIPKEVKKQLWIKYFGKRYNGNCFVCSKPINTHRFEAGHVKSAAKGGSDRIDNLRPICMGCNRSMGKMNLYVYKKKYHG